MKNADPHKGRETGIQFITAEDIEYGDRSVFSELTNWQPLYNLYAAGEVIIVHVELPGVDMSDIIVFLRSRFMIITGTRITPPGITDTCCVFHNLEIPFGRFHRRIEFPAPIETKNYQYDLRNGILTIQLQTVKEKIITVEGG